MKSVLKAPGSMILKLRYDGPLSNFAFKFKSRRYKEVDLAMTKICDAMSQVGHPRFKLTQVDPRLTPG